MSDALPDETRLFHEVDGKWRRLQRSALADTRALSALRLPRITQTLSSASTVMEKIMKGLHAFLEGK
jgi:hypothetical protein